MPEQEGMDHGSEIFATGGPVRGSLLVRQPCSGALFARRQGGNGAADIRACRPARWRSVNRGDRATSERSTPMSIGLCMIVDTPSAR